MEKTRSFLKWPGNKYHCLNYLLPTLSPASRLVEPFTGSAALFMNTHYPCYLLGEVNADLISLFSFIQQEGTSFIEYCQHFFCKNNNQEEQYYKFRAQFNKNIPGREKAALFLYLNRHGYNGLCRYNRKGGYNVPFGRYIKPYFPEKEMQLFYRKSKNVELIHADFRETFRRAKIGDIIYCDPPYAPLHQRSNFSAYAALGFGEEEQIALSGLARETACRGITVIISNHDTDFTRSLYQDSDIMSFPVRRYISRTPEKRMMVQELLAVFRGKT